MHHIPFSVQQLSATLLGTINTGEKPPRDQIALFKELVLKLDLVFNARYHLLKKQLLEDFEPFDPNAQLQTELPVSKLALLEDRFFSNVREMLEKANFRMLSKEEADIIGAHNFLNTVPIEPEWLKLDPVFTRYLDAHRELADAAPSFATRLWIFHRGVGLAKFSGLVLMQKLDIMLMNLLGKCCGKSKRKADKLKKEKELEAAAVADAKATSSKGKEEANEKLGVKAIEVAAAAAKAELASSSKGGSPIKKPGGPVASVFTVDTTKRVTIESQVADKGFLSLMTPVHIQETTFKEVVLLYRVNSGRDQFHSSSNPHSLYLKVFRDIPHADLEVLYPCKHTELRALDTVKFVGAGVFGVISLLMQRQAGEVVGYSALGGFVGVLVTVLFNYQYQKSMYEQSTLADMYSKSKDADKGAVNYLMEEVCLQEVKEALLGYWFLCNSKKPLTQEALDEAIESFLVEMQTVYGYRECVIDFEVDDALDKLIKLQLVEEDGGLYKALPISEGIEVLNRLWATMITAE
jgi:hypothetical protein